MTKTPFIPKAWVFFRTGHGMYLVYMMALSNFSILIYEFAIKEIAWLYAFIPNYWVFMLMFIPIYIPLAVLIGWGHYSTQMEHDLTEWTKRNKPIMAICENQKNMCKELGIPYVSEADIEV